MVKGLMRVDGSHCGLFEREHTLMDSLAAMPFSS